MARIFREFETDFWRESDGVVQVKMNNTEDWRRMNSKRGEKI